MKSPCLNCEHKDRDKNNPVCRDCDLRIQVAFGGAARKRPVDVLEGGMDSEKGTNMKVCKDPDCALAEQPQPIEAFAPSAKSADGRMKICRACMGIKIRAGKKKEISRSLKKKDRPTVGVKKARESNLLTIDFSGHLPVLKKIKEIALSEIRTPEAQVLYWLKEFSLLKPATEE